MKMWGITNTGLVRSENQDARSLICKIDRDELLQVLVKSYLEL